MIPQFARVVALDDDQDHLQKIVLGLARAGFSTFPIHYDAGVFEPKVDTPFPGARLVFTDIHMGAPGYGANNATYASTIINGLKMVVGGGPYGLIFWSQFPNDANSIKAEIEARAEDSDLPLPICWGTVDKRDVFNVNDVNNNSDFKPDDLRKKILDQIQTFKALSLSIAWDERVALAATQVTGRLYQLAKADATKLEDTWLDLMSYLAQEAVGKARAMKEPGYALDSALLPILEDRLSRPQMMASEFGSSSNPIAQRLSTLPLNDDLPKPAAVSAGALNTHYLVEEVVAESAQMTERGMVTALGDSFIKSNLFVMLFGDDADTIIQREFCKGGKPVSAEIRSQMSLHIVELGAECDHVQGKVVAHRYLIAILVPHLTQRDVFWDKNGKFANESIFDVGELQLSAKTESSRLLISCRRYMVLPPNQLVDGVCMFRLRRDTIEELAHRYVTYARRPGVIRFFSK